MEEIRTEQKSGGIAIGKAVLLKQPDLAAERREITAAGFDNSIRFHLSIIPF